MVITERYLGQGGHEIPALDLETALQQNRTMAEVVFDQLKFEIVTGRLKAGDRLVERDLTERFNVSRTPMRQALKQLVHSGLAIEIPYRGVMVRTLSYQFTRDVYDIRMGLEGRAAYLAAQRAGDEDMGTLEAIWKRIDRAARDGDRDEVLVLNSQFHSAIAQATDNELLVTRVNELWISINLARAAAWKDTNRSGSSNDEHRDIMIAVLNRDPERARLAMEAHVRASWELVDAELSRVGTPA